jgi:hypothetical protein
VFAAGATFETAVGYQHNAIVPGGTPHVNSQPLSNIAAYKAAAGRDLVGRGQPLELCGGALDAHPLETGNFSGEQCRGSDAQWTHKETLFYG